MPSLSYNPSVLLQMVARRFLKDARRNGCSALTRALQRIALMKNSCATNRHMDR